MLAYLFYWKGAFAGLHGLAERNKAAAWGKNVLVNKYYFDWLYTDVIVRFVKLPLATCGQLGQPARPRRRGQHRRQECRR